jgi:hypothetical protein
LLFIAILMTSGYVSSGERKKNRGKIEAEQEERGGKHGNERGHASTTTKADWHCGVMTMLWLVRRQVEKGDRQQRI